ncbi:glycerophosphodiester phosphodiesterase [Paenibacillus sanguinis]|uniref:glycerophosphodiester phosphodiesterase n=1 Tax=Paenibacillus sanguinis TaxID=225906 RepID=UPI00035C7A99|nr:glycerophosphodiester phosphodiesterase [Paenibacillus sanguinis]
MHKFPLMTAHTGCMGHPDHSLISLDAALELGADIYEDDIRVTRDGRLILAHDDRVSLHNGGEGSILAMSLEELQDEAISPPLLLETLLSVVKDAGIMMNLDLKTIACLEPLAMLIDRLDMADQVFLSGCGYTAAFEAQLGAPQLRKLLNVDVAHFHTVSYAKAVAHACADSRATGCFGLNLPYELVQQELLEEAHSQGLQVYVWTVSEADDMRRLAGMGVDAITTRELGRFLSVRAELISGRV